MKYIFLVNVLHLLLMSYNVFSDDNSSFVVSTTESEGVNSSFVSTIEPGDEITNSYVLSTTEPDEPVNEKVNNSIVSSTTESGREKQTFNHENHEVNPKIYFMKIHSNVNNRFATTFVTSKVKNLKEVAAETAFSVILPENAFISAFAMEIDGKIYKATVKEKEEAKESYQEAVSRGQSAAHVELNARDSKTFTVSVNIEPQSKVIFRLTYEEFLKRQFGKYELCINIYPGQVVDDLSVKVRINENRPLKFIKTPSVRPGNDISKNTNQLNPSAKTEMFNSTYALVKFDLDRKKQKEFAELLGYEKENGLGGQFVVQYDVERDPQGGEVLVRDGYFVHFFSPSELKSLPKHVVFVLDHSASMYGKKIIQLIDAMQNILSELKETDLFNIVRFANLALVWNASQNKFIQLPDLQDYGNLEPYLRKLNISHAVKATKENVDAAKKIITDKSNLGMTNMIYGLEVGLFLIKKTQEEVSDKYQPMIIFLSDGYPNVGMPDRIEIIDTVTNLNNGTSIFSLSFGDSADRNFLRKLSSQNLGFSKHIYEASDSSLQLQEFYHAISSPLLSNVNFKYDDGTKDVTETRCPILFRGSEMVVAGRTRMDNNVLSHVEGWTNRGPVKFIATKSEAVGSLERLWAYLTVNQLLKQNETTKNELDLIKKALDMSLKYSFVTPVTSLVVVKPYNQTELVEGLSAQLISPWLGLPKNISIWRKESSGLSALSGMYITERSSTRAENVQGNRKTTFVLGPVYTSRATQQSAFLRPYPKNSRRKNHDNKEYFQKFSVTLPQWFENIKINNENIALPQGIFKLGHSGAVATRPYCPKTPKGSVGECVIILDCPEIYKDLTDLNTFLQYFCPLNEFAGVCCPSRNASTPT
ncbi:inter-alpha-trypsin inhibitor heavy chain H4-like [Tribolium madens]|uniref:inter-alpha-trypsin inhibitor heavy chain H4-like n=1 Tax=Tribolium madens TaxID=41895 RepID=UPI001CF73CF5|nr:inter-alpha-trypsin inhibitor heavy chain H4-like [Tribolium madens]